MSGDVALLEALRVSAEEGLLPPPGEPVAVACSGGRDSMALLHGLRRLERWPLHVLTVDHGLRPGAAEDARWVVEIAQRWGCAARALSVEVSAAEGGVEAGARRARYAALEAAALGLGAARLVTAHTADDQGETILMRWGAGAGLSGLRGIWPRWGLISRPILSATRRAVAAYAEACGVPWREDPTNQSHRFTRNRVRALALPALESAMGASWISGVEVSARRVGQDAEALDFLVEGWMSAHLRWGFEGPSLALSALRAAPEGLRRLALRRLWALAAGSPPPRGSGRHLDLALSLASAGEGRATLPSGCGVRVFRGRIEIRGPWQVWHPASPVAIHHPGVYRWGPGRLVVGAGEGPPLVPGLSAEVYAAPFGTAPLWLRRPGDGEAAQRWKKAGVGAADRAWWPVVSQGESLVWIPGCASARSKTEKSLRLRWIPADEEACGA